jgi:hypothetical protein
VREPDIERQIVHVVAPGPACRVDDERDIEIGIFVPLAPGARAEQADALERIPEERARSRDELQQRARSPALSVLGTDMRRAYERQRGGVKSVTGTVRRRMTRFPL